MSSLVADNKATAAGDLWRYSAMDLAELIRDGQVSSREVVDAHLNRIEDVNGSLNAVTAVLTETARATADAADTLRARGRGDLPPLHGVPFTVKENIDCLGSPTTLGIPARAETLPTQDAPVVERLRAAGAIPIARTNMPELGMRIATDNPLWGLTRNPWTPDLTAGGSSGGDASAVASGMTPLGIGNDIGGSVRNPAYCCGIAAIKPTHGRVPFASSFPPGDEFLAAQQMLSNGPMARTVADLRLALNLMSGQHVRDPRSVTVAFQGPSAPRRVAMVTSLPNTPIAPEIVAGIRAAGAALAAAGYEVDEVVPLEIDTINQVWLQFLVSDLELVFDNMRKVLSQSATAALGDLIALAEPRMGHTVLHRERSRLGREWAAFFVTYPLILGPAWPERPFAHGADLVPKDGAALLHRMLTFITPGNLLGIPGVVVPTGVHDGRPVGVQVYADRFRDDLALDAAEVIEGAFGPITPML